MSLNLTVNDYVDYLLETRDYINSKKDYVSELDATTGDGDHWANLNKGFESLAQIAGDLRQLPLDKMLLKIGMTLMSKVGGSSGALYGKGYMQASGALKEVQALDLNSLYTLLSNMLEGIMTIGKSESGQKTMIDALYPAVEAFKEGLAAETPAAALLQAVKDAAVAGAESTAEMKAMRGRASYQENKGVGHLDPGAVTLAYQISLLMDKALSKLA